MKFYKEKVGLQKRKIVRKKNMKDQKEEEEETYYEELNLWIEYDPTI